MFRKILCIFILILFLSNNVYPLALSPEIRGVPFTNTEKEPSFERLQPFLRYLQQLDPNLVIQRGGRDPYKLKSGCRVVPVPSKPCPVLQRVIVKELGLRPAQQEEERSPAVNSVGAEEKQIPISSEPETPGQRAVREMQSKQNMTKAAKRALREERQRQQREEQRKKEEQEKQEEVAKLEQERQAQIGIEQIEKEQEERLRIAEQQRLQEQEQLFVKGYEAFRASDYQTAVDFLEKALTYGEIGRTSDILNYLASSYLGLFINITPSLLIIVGNKDEKFIKDRIILLERILDFGNKYLIYLDSNDDKEEYEKYELFLNSIKRTLMESYNSLAEAITVATHDRDKQILLKAIVYYQKAIDLSLILYGKNGCVWLIRNKAHAIFALLNSEFFNSEDEELNFMEQFIEATQEFYDALMPQPDAHKYPIAIVYSNMSLLSLNENDEQSRIEVLSYYLTSIKKKLDTRALTPQDAELKYREGLRCCEKILGYSRNTPAFNGEIRKVKRGYLSFLCGFLWKTCIEKYGRYYTDDRTTKYVGVSGGEADSLLAQENFTRIHDVDEYVRVLFDLLNTQLGLLKDKVILQKDFSIIAASVINQLEILFNNIIYDADKKSEYLAMVIQFVSECKVAGILSAQDLAKWQRLISITSVNQIAVLLITYMNKSFKKIDTAGREFIFDKIGIVLDLAQNIEISSIGAQEQMIYFCNMGKIYLKLGDIYESLQREFSYEAYLKSLSYFGRAGAFAQTLPEPNEVFQKFQQLKNFFEKKDTFLSCTQRLSSFQKKVNSISVWPASPEASGELVPLKAKVEAFKTRVFSCATSFQQELDAVRKSEARRVSLKEEARRLNVDIERVEPILKSLVHKLIQPDKKISENAELTQAIALLKQLGELKKELTSFIGVTEASARAVDTRA